MTVNLYKTNMPVCKQCSKHFPIRLEIEGVVRYFKNRTRCLECSPFGKHNIRKLHPNDSPVKLCTKCGKHNTRFYGTGLCNSCHVTAWRKRTKQKSVDYLGGQCKICGYNKCISSLDFHHKNSNEKEFAISGQTISWDKVKSELDKCILVCRNCHGEIHAGITEMPTVDMTEINKLAEQALGKSSDRFMYQKHAMLDGLTPFQAVQQGRQDDVERILHNIEYSLPA